MGLPARPEDRKVIKSFAPELFFHEPDHENEYPRSAVWNARQFRDEVRIWISEERRHPFVIVRDDLCPNPDCPLKLSKNSHSSSGSQASAQNSDHIVVELMTVAGGWKGKKKTFLDTARRVHGGHGPAKDLLVTDPFIFADKSEDDTAGGVGSFLSYLDVLDIPDGSTLTIFQPPFAKGNKKEQGPLWRRCVKRYSQTRGYKVRFDYFKSGTGSRFHDRFYLVRHNSGNVTGLFGPSMNGLNDKSFALIGELEPQSLKRVCQFIDGWA